MKKNSAETRRNIEDAYPLSPTQEGLLLHSLNAPESGVYVTQAGCTLTHLDVPAFEMAWRRVMERHAVLRTAFVWKSVENPLQVVGRDVTPLWERQDWRGLSPSEQAERFEGYLRADRRKGFRLEKAPLMRLGLMRLTDDSFKFTWSHHHLLLDGWSIFLVLREVLAYYDAFSRGRDLELARPRPYRDYISWLQRQDLARAETFWRATLRGFSSQTFIRPDCHTAASAASPRYEKQQIALSEQDTAALQATARRHRLTLNTVVQGAWALLLSRYAGSDEVVFGATVSGRPAGLEGVEAMVGLFINTLPVRARLGWGEGAGGWLRGLQSVQAEAREYEFAPLRLVQRWGGGGRGEALFESIVVFENYPVDESLNQQNGRLVASDTYAVEQTNYPLTLQAALGRQLRLQIDYENRYEPQTVKRMLEYLRELLVALAGSMEQPLDALPLLPTSERRRVLVEWNETAQEYRRACVHELFEEQARRTPSAVALVCGEERLTYRELDERADAMARRLRALGVGAESRVAVLMERSVEMVVGLLGVLKAGGAYVPIDAGYPRERVRFMLEDSGARVVLTQRRLAGLAGVAGAEVLCAEQWSGAEEVAGAVAGAAAGGGREDVGGGVEGGSDAGGRAAVSADNLAYVIYTSGSTGTPKGAMNTHAGISNRLQWMQQAFELRPSDRVLQKTPFSFDVSVWEFFWPLMYGACLVMARPGGHQDSAYLMELIEREQITTLHFVPSMLAVFLEEAEGGARCRSLRRVICSGEVLPAALQERFFARFPEVELHNLYGPTEAAVDVTAWQCQRDSQRPSVPIGRPIANIRLYVLDEKMRPVPVGALGELYIGGVGVGRGYWGRAGLTAEKFVPDPFGAEAGGRLYRSGDRVSYRGDGNIEYIGRTDEQVKVRGNRVELGEIESVLREHERVREAAAKVWEAGRDGQKRVIGYVVLKAGEEASGDELRGYLRGRLPEYMVPNVVQVLEEMPLTPSGKVDRKALPEVNVEKRADEVRRVSARTPVEEVLAGIWERVLGVEEVGVHDNFFDLGGDSIQSIRVRAQAQRVGLDLTVEQLLRFSTISELARELGRTEDDFQPSPKTEPFGLLSAEDRQRIPDHVEDAYPLAALQAGMLFHSQMTAGAATYHDVFSAHLQTPFEPRVFREVAQALAARHPILRTAFDLTNYTQPLQLVHRDVLLPLHFEDLRHLNDGEQEQALSTWREREKRRNFDWTAPPLLHLYVHRRSEESFQFTVSFHHAILDGWSVAVMLSEFFGAYLSALNGDSAATPPSPPATSYRDFIALERAALQSPLAEQYWNRLLEGAPASEPPGLPGGDTDHDRFETGVFNLKVPAEVFDGLTRLTHSTGVPLRSVLLAAHLRALRLLCGQTDVITGLVLNGRPEETDGDRVLGLFLNTVPFRFQLKGGTWKELVTQTFQAERECFPYRRYPVAELQRKRGQQPLFHVLFNYNNFHIYKSLGGRVKVLSQDAFEQTNFPLVANFASGLSGRELTLRLYYDASKYPPAQVQAIGDYYQTILAEMALNPSDSYQYKSLLPAEEQALVLKEWNETVRDYPRDLCLHELFEGQARRTPSAVALAYGDERLTYRELDERADALARRLRALGVGVESRVAVLMERSVEMVVGLLGVLKAGGAYVPIDAGYPSERVRFMLEDSGARVVLTQRRLAELAGVSGAEVVCAEEWSGAAAGIGREDVGGGVAGGADAGGRAAVGADNLAYVIYTSGSTGRPKGVCVSHRALCNHMAWMLERFPLDRSDTVLQKTPLSFDASVWEFWAPLLSGARLVMARPEGHRDAAYLIEEIRRHGVTTLQVVPTQLRMLLGEGLGGCQSLRRVFCGGEALGADEARRFEGQVGAELINLYGPTEATIDATYKLRVRGEDGRREVPIGRPIANTRAYVLDGGMRPAPVGAVGELYLGGAGLARGYLRRPSLTAGRFVPDPFAEEGGARLYRTGDAARWSGEGMLEYVGRLDDQVKLRGFRIELGEVEAALCEHEAVAECVAAVRGEGEDRRLVAYVVWRGAAAGGEGLAEELRQSLSARLPPYMVPQAIVTLDKLPLTANGKLDRRALPEPRAGQRRREYEEPAGEVEVEVARVWGEVLGVERGGAGENFFELGGHSLLATQVISRIREVLHVEIALHHLFEEPTVRGLAALIERMGHKVEAVGVTKRLGAEEAKHILNNIEQLSGEDVDALLNSVLAERKAAE